MPVATVGNESIGQSSAINYYFAKEFGLMGGNNMEAAQIMAISEHLKEMQGSFKTITTNNVAPTPEALNLWFDGGAKDITGHADRPGQPQRYLTWWMGRIESVLGSKGFAVGGKLSLADVLLYSTFADSLSDEQTSKHCPEFKRFPFSDAQRSTAALVKHPKMNASCNTVAANANIQKWLKMRGVQNF